MSGLLVVLLGSCNVQTVHATELKLHSASGQLTERLCGAEWQTGALCLLCGSTGWALAKQNQDVDDLTAAVEKATAAAAAAGSNASAGR